MNHIIVGMSGGVDSSIAAVRLLDLGYQVSGLFMKNWEEDDTETYCAAAADLADAQQVCKQLGIELNTVNFAHEYWDRVFQLFLEEYRRGRTPNPDVVCNKEIKFKEFLKWALHLGADFIATGHYARIKRQNGHILLCKGQDPKKDQSYFLHTLDQEALKCVHFPIGEIHKEQVREIAQRHGLATHDKKDSTGICFIGARRFSDFLSHYLPARPGKIKTPEGETIGAHHGAVYYTIGQRQGLGIGGEGEPWYVAHKDVEQNIVYAVQGHDHPALLKSLVIADTVHWVAGCPPPTPVRCKAKIRYRQHEQPCRITRIEADHTRIEFDQPQWAVTPGQSIVFFQQEVCLGGGLIRSALE